MERWQNDVLVKWKTSSLQKVVDKMASWMYAKMTNRQVDVMASWQNDRLIKCKVDKKTSWRKKQFAEMTSWANIKLIKF